MSRRTVDQLLTLGALALLALFLVYPIALTTRAGFADDPTSGDGFTLTHILRVFQNPTTLEGLANALKIATLTTVLSILIALPLAALGARRDFPGRRLFGGLLLAPLILPPFVGAIGVQAILGRAGALSSLLGVEIDILGAGFPIFGGPGSLLRIDSRMCAIAIVEALHLYPIIYLNAAAALANLDPALDEAAENLGAGPIRRFGRITLPLIRPGLFAGGTIVFIWSLTELGTPLIFGFDRITPVQILSGLREVATSPEPYALTVVLLALALGLYGIGRGLLGRRGHAMQTRASRAAAEAPRTGAAGWSVTALHAIVILMAVVPHLGVILTSFSGVGQWYHSVLPQSWTLEHYENALRDPVAFGSIANSLLYASLAMALDIGLGLLIAYLLVNSTARGRRLLDTLSMAPLAVPGLVIAFGYVAMTLRWPLAPGDPLHGVASVLGTDPNPLLLLVIAYGVRRLPYIVRAAAAGLEQTSGDLEDAAINLGASRLTAVRRIIVPLIAANLIAGGLLVFSFSMLEVSDSLILAQQQSDYPVTRAIWDFFNRLGDGQHVASAMGVWGMALLLVTLLGASALIGRKMGALFRI